MTFLLCLVLSWDTHETQQIELEFISKNWGTGRAALETVLRAVPYTTRELGDIATSQYSNVTMS